MTWHFQYPVVGILRLTIGLTSVAFVFTIRRAMSKTLEYCEKMNIKYVLDGDEVWYRAADVGRILKLKNVRSSLNGRPVSESRTMRMPTNGGDQKTTFLNLKFFRIDLSLRKRKHFHF